MTTVIIPAAGSGTRLGEPIPKAFVGLGGITILERCVRGVLDAGITSVVVVVPDELRDEARRLVPAAQVVAGGLHRTDSVRAGLSVAGDSDVVLVHDAARPLTPTAVFGRVIDAVTSGARAVIPALPVVDTLKRVDADGNVTGTVDRDTLRAVQTPQGFDRQTLIDVYASASDVATDDAGLAERAGIPVRVVEGDPLAFKITTPWDLRIARDVIAERDHAVGMGNSGTGNS